MHPGGDDGLRRRQRAHAILPLTLRDPVYVSFARREVMQEGQQVVVAEKKSIFGFIKDAFVEEIPVVDAKPALVTRNTPLPPLPPGQPAVPVPASATVTITADPVALSKLEGLLMEALPPTYGAFQEQYEQLREVIPDDTMRFKAALKTSKTSVAQLSTDLDQLLAAMTRAHGDFAKKFQEQRAKVIGAVQDGVNTTSELIKSRQAQMQAIQEEVASLQSKLSTDMQRMHDEEQRLTTVQQGFEAAHAQVVSRLEEQKERIASMAKG